MRVCVLEEGHVVLQVRGGAPATAGARSADDAPRAGPVPRRPRSMSRSSIAVLLIGLAVTAALSWIVYVVNSRNEYRLLKLQAEQTGTVLQVILPAIETPLASAAEIAATNGGDVHSFRSYISTYVGAKGVFTSASLWSLRGSSPRLVTAVGPAPRLATAPGKAARFFAEAVHTPTLSVIGLLDGRSPRLGYGYTSAGSAPSYAVYGESAIPVHRRTKVASGSPFADLRFALYLGRTATPRKLLETDAARLPIQGHTATVVVPFGDNALTLVAASTGKLGGTLASWLWWIVAVAGSVFAIVASITAERLVRRQRAAEHLTTEVEHLLGEQRSIAESLQHALLPQTTPAVAGTEIAVRYIPGTNGVDIGGDWYDVIPLDEARFFFVVGDVSGRGVEAGSVMASLLFAIRGFVSEGHGPGEVLDRLAHLLNVTRDKHFATVLCGVADVDRHEIALANAGHLPVLLIADGHAEFVQTEVGPPIGVPARTPYRTVTVPVPPRATLFAYTDGLVERRDETIDEGMQRLKTAAGGEPGPPEQLLATVMSSLAHDGGDDDTAILGVRWLH